MSLLGQSPDRIAIRLADGPFRQATDDDALHLAIHNLMRAGYGTEDIALKLGCPLEDVAAERDRLRQEGRLDELYTGRIGQSEIVLVEPAPLTEAEEFQQAVEDVAWAAKAKGQMLAKDLKRARKRCRRCDGFVQFALLGPKAHLRATCETPSCLWVIE